MFSLICGLSNKVHFVIGRKALFEKDGAAIWAKVLKGALRSSAFLGLYCTLCWRGACVGFQATQSASPPVIAASCWTGGSRSIKALGALLHQHFAKLFISLISPSIGTD